MGKYVDIENTNVHDYVTTWDCNCSEYGRQTVMAVDDVNYLPTVDAEEIKHGHWYGVNHYQDKASGQCSECKKHGALRTSRDDWGLWYIDMPRCPNCGAIMDGKVNYM